MKSKRKLKLLAWVLGLGAAAAFYLAAVSSLRGQMESMLSQACKRPVQIESAQIVFPLAVRLSGLEVSPGPGEDRAPFRADWIQASLLSTVMVEGRPGGEVEFHHPQLYLEWTPEVRQVLDMGGGWQVPSSGVPIARALVQDAEISFVDRTAVPNVYCNLRRGSFSIRTNGRPGEREFSLSGALLDRQGKEIGSLKAEGTYELHGPVDAQVTLLYGDLGGLAPYLKRVLGTAPAQGSMELKTRLTVHEGVLMAHNDVTAEGVVFSGNAPTVFGLEGDRLVEFLKDPEGKVHLSFIVAGKLGEKLDWSDLTAGALREAMRQAMSRSIQSVLQQTEQKKPIEERMRRKLDTLDR